MNTSSTPPDDADPVNSVEASVARVYDYALGGKDNFEVDRKFAHAIEERDPELWTSMRLNKAFGSRVVRHLATRGVRQFLDLGSGIPTSPPSVHETARAIDSSANVVYVDHDPVVVAHNQALRAFGPGLSVVQESFLNPAAVFEHEDFVRHIDVNEPVAILLFSVLQNTTDDKVMAVMDDLRARLAPGSCLAISHIADRTAEVVKEAVHEKSRTSGYPKMWFRSQDELAEFFAGWQLLAPGIVDYLDWHPDQDLVDHRPDLNTQFSCGVGILPG